MFEITNEAVANLVMLAKEGETMDPIDWGDFKNYRRSSLCNDGDTRFRNGKKSLDRWRNYC